MNFQPLNSSNLSGASYDKQTETLYVRFTSGAVYQYRSVPEADYEDLMSAGSAGQFFNDNIKNSYSYSRL